MTRAALREAGPLVRRTMADHAADALRDRILRGELAEHAPIRQDAVAAELGISRIPVREALQRLEAEGLVEWNPHYGATVSSLSLDEIEELFDLRAVLESSLARRAVPRLRAGDLAAAGAVLERYSRAFRARRVAEWSDLNWQFHATLLAPAGRERTLGLAHNLHQQSGRYMRMQLALTAGEARARQEHRAILASARRGDAAGTARLLRMHIRKAGRQLITFLETQRGQADRPSRRKAGADGR